MIGGVVGRIFTGIERALLTIAAIAVTLISLVLVFQVFMRYVLNSPTVWSEEFATLMFVWCVMAAIPVAVRHSEHIAVTLVVDRMHGKVRRTFVVVAYVLTAALFALVTVYAAMMLPTGARQLMTGLTIASGVDVTLLAMYLMVPIGMGLSFLFSLEKLVAALRGDFDEPIDVVAVLTAETSVDETKTPEDKDV
ncbi:TRAP transporter small permease [Pseudoclavibacter terrae]|uniref:TRAP transporter small permease n=1 Tax=Pseudoclavibacter terrae TaxID=1530195 RepID=A0A7J5B0T7_9MICO|nr:TRAP transporter small permease [Pseudoclavibacter terrae]KAB1637531.1 TRAP transporter small permease [Pseudoclavibacter terrae]